MEEELFDIEYWLPFNGGQYHCTIAVGVTQTYVDKVQTQYNIDLEKWKYSSHLFMPFFHTLNIVKHEFMPNNKSFQKSEKHNEDILKAKEEGRKEGLKQSMRSIRYYITNQARLKEFERDHKDKIE